MSTTSTTTSLTDAVRLHTGYLDDDEFADTMREVAKHSFEIYTFYEQFDEHHGWRIPGFTYYEDTAAFYDEHHDLIWEVLGDECDASGYESPLALIADFKGAWTAGRPWRRQLWGDGSFKNLLAWYALQYVARVSVEEREAGTNNQEEVQ